MGNLEKPSYDDINTPVVIMVGIISAILTLLAMMFVQGLYYHWEKNLPAAMVDISRSADPVPEQKMLLEGSEGGKSIGDAIEVVAQRFGK